MSTTFYIILGIIIFGIITAFISSIIDWHKKNKEEHKKDIIIENEYQKALKEKEKNKERD